jgi:hypothetical protein
VGKIEAPFAQRVECVGAYKHTFFQTILPFFLSFRMASFLNDNNFLSSFCQCLKYAEYEEWLSEMVDEDASHPIALARLRAEADTDAGYGLVEMDTEDANGNPIKLTLNLAGKTLRQAMNALYEWIDEAGGVDNGWDFSGINDQGEVVLG